LYIMQTPNVENKFTELSQPKTPLIEAKELHEPNKSQTSQYDKEFGENNKLPQITILPFINDSINSVSLVQSISDIKYDNNIGIL